MMWSTHQCLTLIATCIRGSMQLEPVRCWRGAPPPTGKTTCKMQLVAIWNEAGRTQIHDRLRSELKQVHGVQLNRQPRHTTHKSPAKLPCRGPAPTEHEWHDPLPVTGAPCAIPLRPDLRVKIADPWKGAYTDGSCQVISGINKNRGWHLPQR